MPTKFKSFFLLKVRSTVSVKKINVQIKYQKFRLKKELKIENCPKIKEKEKKLITP